MTENVELVDPGESYADTSTFVRLLETSSRVRILDVFLRKHYTELTAAEAADLAGIDVSTFHRNVGVFEEMSVIEEAEEVAGAQRYRLKEDSPVAKAFGKAQHELLDHAQKVE
jgi:DNA-binding IclR family transcriptional regulator